MSTVITRPPARRNWFLRVLSWPLALILIVGTVAVGDQILKHTPGSDEVSRPFIHKGRIGDVVDALSFTATVDSVRGSRSVADDDDDYTTDGVFVLVTFTLTAKTDSTALSTVSVVGHGQIFKAVERFYQEMTRTTLQPGIPKTGEVAFEVPKGAAAGLSIQLSSDSLDGNENQTAAEIDLGIDEAKVTTWLANSAPLELHPPEVQ